MKQKNKKDYIIIIGCGRLGASLANTLSDNGDDVLIIDNNKDSFRKLSPYFGGLALAGDATEIEVLNEAQIKKATAIITVTNNDNINIMAALLAKELFNIQKVIARLYDPERECVYEEFGIKTICPTALSANLIQSMLCDADKEATL